MVALGVREKNGPEGRCRGQVERNQSKKYGQGAWKRTSYPMERKN